MRPLYPVNVLRYVRQISSACSAVRFSRRTFCAFLLPFLAAMAVSLGAVADDADPFMASTPMIEEFEVTFDGIDQYWITGVVTGCADLNNIEIEFMDAVYGHKCRTAPDGSFQYMAILSDPFNNTFSAIAKSNDGMLSPWAVYYLY